MVRTDIRFAHAFGLEPAHAFEEQTLPQTHPLKVWVSGNRLEVPDPTAFIGPDDAKRSDLSVRRNDKNLMFGHIHWRLHKPQCARPIFFKRLTRSKCRMRRDRTETCIFRSARGAQAEPLRQWRTIQRSG